MDELTTSSVSFPTAPSVPASGAAVAIESQRAVAEVQAAMMLARRFPRDQAESYARIMQACARKSLAEVSQYEYSRGGTKISGPSIRLAEAMAQLWGNLQFGIRELERNAGSSVMESYCWDIETNVRRSMQFQVRHVRDTKKGSYALDDERDIYELVANMGARRLRACILAVIPGDVQEAAVEACNKTLNDPNHVEPIETVVKQMLAKFLELGVTTEMIEKRLQHKIDATSRLEVQQLRKIYTAIRDGIHDRTQYFDLPPTEPTTAGQDDGTRDLADRVANVGKPSTSRKEGEIGDVGIGVRGETGEASTSAAAAPRRTLKDAQKALLAKDWDLALEIAGSLKADEARAIQEEVKTLRGEE